MPRMPEWVWVRQIPGKSSLQKPYEGPFKVIKQERSVITIERNGRVVQVNLDRVKPAFIMADPDGPREAIPESRRGDNNTDDNCQPSSRSLDQTTENEQTFSRSGRPLTFRLGRPVYS